MIILSFLPLLTANAAYPPDFFQYGRFNNFVYNPAYVGVSGTFTGSYYMTNPGILLGFELSPKGWSNSVGYVFDQVGSRHTLAWNHKLKLGKGTFLRLGLCGSLQPLNPIQSISTGFGALLYSGNFKAGASFNDFFQIGNNRLSNPISSYYTISYDIRGDYMLWMPQFAYYTNYHSWNYSIITLNTGISYLLTGGGLVISGGTVRCTLNMGARVKNSALLLGINGYPINGQPSIDKRFNTYHLILRIQI